MKNEKNHGITFIIAVLVSGHLIGTMTHTLILFDIIRSGFINYARASGVSPIVNVYWMSLTVIDPLIAFLLIKNVKKGVPAAFINILINVLVNSSLQIATLQVITMHSVYDTLGNIFNGLQIALLLFSSVTLPLFYIKPELQSVRSSRYVQFFSLFPILSLAIGLLIHLVGLVNLIRNFESLWNLWVHVSMTAFNTGLMYALWRRMRLGYIVGIIGFGIFGLLQGGFAVAIFIGYNVSFNLAMAITISMCCISISALLSGRDRYQLSYKNMRR